MKVVFLDVDGVLNSLYSHSIDNSERWTEDEVSMYHIEKLKRLIQETNAKIVLSSCWKNYLPMFIDKYELNDFQIELGQILLRKLKEVGLEIYDVLPDLERKVRRNTKGYEIEAWLKEHLDVEVFVVIDDEDIVLPEQKSVFLKTTFKDGLTDEIVDKAIEILNK